VIEIALIPQQQQVIDAICSGGAIAAALEHCETPSRRSRYTLKGRSAAPSGLPTAASRHSDSAMPAPRSSAYHPLNQH